MIHALATQAAVKSRTTGAHRSGAAQTSPEAVLLTAAMISMRCDESHLCPPLAFGLLLKKVSKELNKTLGPV